MKKGTRLEVLIIDPQVDFCCPAPRGSLYVSGADKDMTRLAELIRRLKDKIYDIHVTLDSHHLVDIAHPIFWIDSKGNHPTPFFTVITSADVVGGKWRTTNPSMMTRAVEYVKTLEANKRYALCIWPPHCLIGSDGAIVVPELFKSLIEWETEFAQVDFVTKGSNFWTEHYSAVQADVPDPNDPGTMLNTRLINTLQVADIIVLAGEALDYCLANTVRDIANNFGEENIKKFVLLEDATSLVNAPGLENLGPDFLKEMKGRGMQTCKIKDFMI